MKTALRAALILALGLACRSAAPPSEPTTPTTPVAPVAPAPEASVKPGINANFLDPALDVDEFTRRFEGESREIAVQRAPIAAALELRPGMAVADVGAGTGLFLELLAQGVGPSGRVYALEIAPAFVEHLAQRARDGGWTQVEARRCGERSVDLPPASIDRALLCDVYHHFEFPHGTMTSLHEALRPGGVVVLVDFERIPGVSREWTLGHVRADKQTVIEELASFGFELERELTIEGLSENYALRFVRR